MDDQLEAARRAHAADRTDDAAARRLQAELERAGRHDEVLERFAFELACDLKWEDLHVDTADPFDSERYCARCERSVHSINDLKSFQAAAAAGECVRVHVKPTDQVLAIRKGYGHYLATGGEFTFVQEERAPGRRLPCVLTSPEPTRPAPFRGFAPGFESMGRVVRRAPKGAEP